MRLIDGVGWWWTVHCCGLLLMMDALEVQVVTGRSGVSGEVW